METPGDEDDNEKKLSPTEEAILDMMRKQSLQSGQQLATPQQIIEAQGGDKKQHKFWDTQPMPHGTRGEHPEGPIVPDKPIEEIREEPYVMPGGFEWSNVNVKDDAERLELYNLLANNYVEDDDALFRFDYSHEFLLWALTPPGFRDDFLFGVRSTSNKKLVAFISAIPTRIQVYDKETNVVEINFLCVHKKLRSKRLAPVLIKEVTRRVNLTGVFQAVYTAGTVLPVPVASCRYYHRSLNPKKLVRIGFSRLGSRMTMARMQKLYKLPDKAQTPGLRKMEVKDVEQVHALLTEYLKQFSLKILFTKDEVEHWLMPREKVIDTFVIETEQANGKKKITDMVSFYHLPSAILNQNDTLHAAYSFYNVATSIPMVDLMKDALIEAKKTGSDVFNALNLMQNDDFLKTHKFGIGDGNLQYYIYNWNCPEMPSDKVGIVLL